MITEGSTSPPSVPEMTSSPSMTAAQDVFPKSRIPEIWKHFYSRLEQIDKLENRLDEHVKRFRRRVTNDVDQNPPYRKSHLRLFATHNYKDSEDGKEDPPPLAAHTNDSRLWTLVLEGKLLIGLLDHASALQVDKHGAFTREKGRSGEDVEDIKASDVLPTVPEPGAADGTDVGTGGPPTTRADRNKYRSVGDIEEDPVEPTLFTHAFDKVEVAFQTIWQPETPPQSASSLTPPKKSRKRKADTISHTPATVHQKHLKSSGENTRFVWDKTKSGDAHAFHVHYQELPAPFSTMKFHSVVATIIMHPTVIGETVYRPSEKLAEKFFPKHSTAPHPKIARRQKAAAGEAMGKEESSPPIPLENEIHVPSHLTMNEILLCLWQYITDKKLQDESDRSFILCDKVLADLLDCESLNFGDLQSTLLAKNLVTALDSESDPILLTYVMKPNTTSPQEPPPPGEVMPQLPEGHVPQVLSFDMDVYIPNFFHWRAREIMRRIKRREFEYTSSRTKGRYMLVASRGNEDTIKTKIGECISGHGYAEENIPIFLALAKAAPPNSEARGAAQIDAKTCALMGRLDECTRQAQTAWKVVGTCQELSNYSSIT